MRDITLLILACRKLLDIKTPFNIEYRTKLFRGDNADAAGLCYRVFRKEKLVKFRVVISCTAMVGAGFESYSVIAHELVHAKLIEANLHNPQYHHCENFQKLCKKLEKHLKLAGFPIIDPLYDKETDKS
jgi:hypothetical protein